MSNLATLADELGRLNAMKAELETKIQALKTEFKATKLDVLSGQHFTITQSKVIRQNLNIEAVKADMGQAWFDDHSKLSEVTTILIKANPVMEA